MRVKDGKINFAVETVEEFDIKFFLCPLTKVSFKFSPRSNWPIGINFRNRKYPNSFFFLICSNYTNNHAVVNSQLFDSHTALRSLLFARYPIPIPPLPKFFNSLFVLFFIPFYVIPCLTAELCYTNMTCYNRIKTCLFTFFCYLFIYSINLFTRF